MPKPSVEPTTAENLEAKFDAGEDVLDYFDLRTARIEAAAEFGRGVAASRMPSVNQLQRAVSIAEQIQKLENELSAILVKRGAPAGKRSRASRSELSPR